jgi:replicative DNA helicase
MEELIAKTLGQLEDRRKKLLSGGLNCVPTPFKRFENDFPGLEQSQYICVTSFTKGGKTQLVSYMFIFELIWFSYFTKANIDFHIIYFALEETRERITQRFMSVLSTIVICN